MEPVIQADIFEIEASKLLLLEKNLANIERTLEAIFQHAEVGFGREVYESLLSSADLVNSARIKLRHASSLVAPHIPPEKGVA